MTHQEIIEVLQAVFKKHITPRTNNLQLTAQEANSMLTVAPVDVCTRAMESYANWLRRKSEAGVVLHTAQIKSGLRTACANLLQKLQQRKGMYTDFTSSVTLPTEPRDLQQQRSTPEAPEDNNMALRLLFQSTATDDSWCLTEKEVEAFIRRSSVKTVREAIHNMTTKYSARDFGTATQVLSDEIDKLLWEREAAAFA